MARLHARPFHAVALLSRIEVLMRHTGPCIQIGGYKRQIPIRQLNVDKLAIRRVGSRMESETRVRVLEVTFRDGEKAILPRANVESIDQ